MISRKLLSQSFLYSVLVIPATSLLWRYDVPPLKLNWIIFLYFCFAILLNFFWDPQIRRKIVPYAGIVLGYAIVFLLHKTSYESLFRISLALFPLLLIRELREYISDLNYKLFWKLYLLILVIPLVISILQLLGYFSFEDPGKAFWLIDRGRISGGYMKPNNLVTYLFPAYLYGFYLLDKKQTRTGTAIILICILVVITASLRIAIIIYGLTLLSYFAQSFFQKAITKYYYYFGPFVVGIVGIICLNLSFDINGPIRGLRERLPMWQAHADDFFHYGLIDITFGHTAVTLPDHYNEVKEVQVLDEAHNNSFRIIKTFGIVGFFIYCYFMRRVILSRNMKESAFYGNACILYYIVYSVTNEPSFFVSIVWCAFIWMIMTFRGEAK